MNLAEANPVVQLGDITKAIVTFSNSPEYRELDAFYQRKSNFEILGIHRNETRHSRFISWLLDPAESQGLGTYGLKKFLEVCVISRLESKQRIPPGVPLELIDELVVGTTEIEKAAVTTEKPLDKGSRIDIHVNCLLARHRQGQKRLAILIENKVDSTEHDSQTSRYSKWLQEHSADQDFSLLVYLTPVPTLKLNEFTEPACECKDFLQINYQYLVDYLIEPALVLIQPTIARDFVADYLRALSVRSVNIETKGDEIMATSEHERKLLTAFWEKHELLIRAALYVIGNDPNQDEEIRKGASSALQTLGTKDYSLYTIALDGNDILQDVKKTSVGREVARVLIEKAGISEAEFAKLKSNRASAFDLLKRKEDITENEQKYNRYRVGREEPLKFKGVDYHVSGNWGENNIPKFQQFLSSVFPRIQLKKQNGE